MIPYPRSCPRCRHGRLGAVWDRRRRGGVPGCASRRPARSRANNQRPGCSAVRPSRPAGRQNQDPCGLDRRSESSLLDNQDRGDASDRAQDRPIDISSSGEGAADDVLRVAAAEWLRYRAAAPFKIRSNVRGEARKCRGPQTLGLPICSLPILQRRQAGEPQYDGGSEHLESKRGRRSAAESHDEREGNRGEEVGSARQFPPVNWRAFLCPALLLGNSKARHGTTLLQSVAMDARPYAAGPR
jgi:hypothetical protein